MKFTSRQIEIIEAAAKLFGESGIQNVTTKHLAKEMGFSEPALYRHFKGKTDILVSVLQYYSLKMSSGLQASLSNRDNGLAKVGTLINYLFDFFENNPSIILVILAEASFQYEKALSDEVNQTIQKMQHLVKSILEEGIHDGSIRTDSDIWHLSAIALGSIRFTVLQWRLNNYESGLATKGSELFQSLKLLIRT